MAAQGIKIHQIKKHTYVSFLVAVICLFIGLQYIEIPEMRQTGILAVVLGLLMLIAAVYMFVTPVIILTDDLIHFRSGNAAKKRCGLRGNKIMVAEGRQTACPSIEER